MTTRIERAAAKARADRTHDKYVQRTYGLEAGQYAQWLDAQDGRCAICMNLTRRRRLAVDHDHNTGKPRGALLCYLCNKYLGHFENNPITLYNLIRYAEGIIEDLGGLPVAGLPEAQPVVAGRLPAIRVRK